MDKKKRPPFGERFFYRAFLPIDLVQHTLQGVKTSLETTVRNDERRRHRNDLPPWTARQKDKPVIAHFIDDLQGQIAARCKGRIGHFETNHEACAAHVGHDRGMLLL